MKKAAFTICSNNYLAHAKILGESLLSFHPNYKFHIVLVDKKAKEIDYEEFNHLSIIEIEEFNIPQFYSMAESYNIIELNTAVKPFCFKFFLAKYDIVKYIDPDIKFFNSMSDLDEIHNNKSIILTPHITSPIPLDYPHMKENIFLNYGIYNLGFLSLSNSKQTDLFLNWWKERLTKFCLIDTSNGLFVDQLWINFAPIYFLNDIHTSQHIGLNMAYWNFHERLLSKNIANVYTVNKNKPLIFFHFSGFNPSAPQTISNKNNSLTIDKRPDVKEIFQSYKTDLINNGYYKFQKIPFLFNKERRKLSKFKRAKHRISSIFRLNK